MAVKVQKPEKEGIFSNTFMVARILGKIAIDENADIKNKKGAEAIFNTFIEMGKVAFESEFDFAKEVAGLRALQKAGLKTPKVYDELSSDKVIVMDKVEDTIPLVEFMKIANNKDRKRLSTEYMASLIKMLRHGVIHGDPHSGNVLVDAQKKLTWIDPSPLVTFSVFELIPITRLIWGLKKGNRDLIINSLAKISSKKPGKQKLKQIKTDCQSLDSFKMATILAENDLLPNPKYISLTRAFVEGIGTLAEIYPEKKSPLTMMTLVLKASLKSLF